jgi:hypothetical protein
MPEFGAGVDLSIVEEGLGDIEGLLGEGLPSELDDGALKVVEQSPLSGFATEAKQDDLLEYTDGIEELLGGGLPSELDADSLKVTEQAPLTGFATEAKQDDIIGAMIQRATDPVIYNVTMTNANTEYSQALPTNCKKFLIRCRAAYDVKLAFTSGESGSDYVTISAGGAYWEDFIQLAATTLYFQCGTAGQVAEIVAWA